MNHSETLFEQAQKYIPGGVNSPVRAFRGVGGTPVFFKHAEGAYLYDADGKLLPISAMLPNLAEGARFALRFAQIGGSNTRGARSRRARGGT